MAYPTGMLAIVLESIDQRAINVKKYCQGARVASAAGPVASGQILSLYQSLRFDRAALVSAALTPGLAQYARDQKNNQSLDVVAEFNGMTAAIDQVTGWIATNFPTDPGTSALLERTLGADQPVERTFTTAQLSGLRTQLDALIATIA